MASCPRRDMFAAERPHFFKIILEETIRDKKLGVPKRFARKYGGFLSNPVVLKVPGGRIWQVEVTKFDGEVWFQNGWQGFLEYYSLVHGSFLVFEYDKSSCHFNVTIFDKSASEIEYPVSVTNGDDKEINDLQEEIQEPKIIEETENDSYVETLDDSVLGRKRKEKALLSSLQPQKMMKVENPTGNTSLHFPGKQVEVDFVGKKQTSDCIAVRKKPLTTQEKTKAVHRASVNFKSDNPFFLIVMQPSYVHPGEKMSIPASFAMKYFPLKHTSDVNLNGLDGRTWSVKFYFNKASNGQPMAKITRGWRVFAEDNCLEVGDVCAFELIMIQGAKATFKVTIFRNKKGDKMISKEEEESNSPGAIAADKGFTSVHPFFKAVISSSYLDTMHVPQNFISNIKQSTER
ncbi:B3 domain-containing transcription factor VRN1 isoform X1 [Manihot esculenta]|uniref:Uncharacterized protein n=1 Tax=Manihot esculenta TaxID=3983 RepID=A0ACB7HFT6_MANES|nr:B3 domain-containing transcription factor VRN1 isoform X1 [Manihot esculenta]KAG8651327.1 hypothetical protein MANES_07G115000v8 [Manihot esculenta]